MPTFSNDLPPQGKHQGYDLRRTPASRPMQAIVTCENLLVCDTHFWHGRTQPCERLVNAEGKTTDDTPCPACVDKQSWRTHVYLSAFDNRTHEHFIFECTANAAKPLAEYFAATGTLRGCIIYASRPKAGPNSKVVIVTNSANLTKTPLPNPPDLIRALAVIWRLPKTALPPERESADRSRVRPHPDDLRSMRNQPDNAAELPNVGPINADLDRILLGERSGNGHARKPQPVK